MRPLERRLSVPVGLLAIVTLALAGCPSDDPYCGDGKCQLSAGENTQTCPQDCPAICGDGACTGNETHASCRNDCPVDCGDGSCDGGETYQSCPSDCPAPPVCGDGTCQNGESTANCPFDCPPAAICGNGFCEAGETANTCPQDCYVAYCGNGVCDFGESEVNCFADCNDHCAPGQVDCFADDLCWSSGVSCTGTLFTCGGGYWRCNSNADWAACCNNTFITCPSGFPYYCASDNRCYTTPQNCPGICNYTAADCGP
jgi:hypothetical protein